MRGGQNRIDLTGQRFGRLEVLGYAYSLSNGAYWSCQCDCGNRKTILGSSLRRVGNTQSCGCLRKEVSATRSTIHGLFNHRFYQTWVLMRQRCYNRDNPNYADYGGRNIVVCEEWDDPVVFIAWTDTQFPVPVGFTLHRKNNDLGYSPSNCEFASDSAQARNKQTTHWVLFQGCKISLVELAEQHSLLNYNTVKARLRRGWTAEDSALVPLKNQHKV